MSPDICLIVGLGNPGPEYAETRHNTGAWFVEALANQHKATLKAEPRFHGVACMIKVVEHECRLFIPTTYMNNSGQAIKTLISFYKISPEAMLIAHDELDFSAGTVKIKQGGGHGGHNGLRDIITHLGTNLFYRLRIGIGHPKHREDVTDYVLHKPSKADDQLIRQAIDTATSVVPDLLAGNIQKAIKALHS